jgi:hypothetical protein
MWHNIEECFAQHSNKHKEMEMNNTCSFPGLLLPAADGDLGFAS